MKGTTKRISSYTDITIDPQSMDCSCEILYDSDLSDTSSKSCDCSECLQANLNAFNDLRQMQQNFEQIKNKKTRAKSQKREVYRNNQETRYNKKNELTNENRNTINRYKSNERMNKKNKNTNNLQEKQQIDGDIEGTDKYPSQEQFNDFLYITKNRTRQYIQHRKKLQQSQKQQKQKLKEKIKKNLEMLQIVSQMKRQQGPKNKNDHQYKWNHSKYQCQCNSSKRHHKEECCRNLKVKPKLDTNLNKLLTPQFQQKRQIILQGLKQERLENQKPSSDLCPYDKCLNHHNRTEQQKIKKIQNFIQKQAKKYEKKVRKQKEKKQQQKKVVQAKLRAIDIKSKQILSRTRRFDPNASRTSFKLSIDNFDTFSELREQKQRRQLIKNAKKQMKQTNALQEKIYEDLEQDEDQGYMPNNAIINKDIIGLKKQDLGNHQNMEYSERILYDAKIKDPKNLKKMDKKNKQKQTKRQLSKTKQLEQKMNLQKEIEKKKKQILDQYSKRNSNKGSKKVEKKEPYNKKIRESYQQSKISNKNIHSKVANSSKDLYKKNYKYEAGKDIQQINAHGDPLLQQYVHHDAKKLSAVAKVKAQYGEQEQQIFTQNINSLSGKTRLKL